MTSLPSQPFPPNHSAIFNAFSYTGMKGYYILFFLSIFLLRNTHHYLALYIAGFGFNYLSNLLLKSIIKQPRPNENEALFNIHVLHHKHIGIERYGMPSRHAQLAVFSTIFIYLSLQSHKYIKPIFLFFIIISIITCSQRVVFNEHTVAQVLVGGACGAVLAYIFFTFSTSLITGKLRFKPDDFAPF
jgi:membrane-associated phospholipid phosphatase